MRAAMRTNRERSPVVIAVEVDGAVQEHVFRPKGLKSDGASVGELRRSLAPGRHRVKLTLATSPDPAAPHQTWSGEIVAEAGRLFVVSYEPGLGFKVE
jgi:hypothetical protein